LFPAAEATSSNVKEERLIGNKAPNIVQHKELAFESTLLAGVEENIEQNCEFTFMVYIPGIQLCHTALLGAWYWNIQISSI
jgi:hypothetical protein